ncbi:MAG: hypothetical protein ABFQ62_01600 [Patescibacteria group bacterium]
MSNVTHKDLTEFGKMLMLGIAEMFDKAYERFDQIDRRFEQVDKRFEQVDKRFRQVDKRFKQVDKQFKKVNKDIKEIRNNNAQVIGELQAIREDQVLVPHQILRNSNKLDKHELRISSLEETTHSRL